MSCCKEALIAPEEAIAVSENKKVDNEVKNAEMKQKFKIGVLKCSHVDLRNYCVTVCYDLPTDGKIDIFY